MQMNGNSPTKRAKSTNRLIEIEATVARIRTLLNSEQTTAKRIAPNSSSANQNGDRTDQNSKAQELEEALAAAEAELSYERVIDTHRTSVSERHYKVISSILVPLVVVVFTAIAGNWLASSFQARDFRTNSIHQYRLETLKRGRDESIKLLSDAQQLKDQTTVFEIYGGGYSWYGPLKSLSDNLERVRTLGHGIVNQTENDSVYHLARQQLATLRTCLEARTADAGNKCSKAFDESVFRKIADFYSLQLLSLHKIDA
jgi:hypothetical protein